MSTCIILLQEALAMLCELFLNTTCCTQACLPSCTTVCLPCWCMWRLCSHESFLVQVTAFVNSLMQDKITLAAGYDRLGSDVDYSLATARVLASFAAVQQGDMYDKLANLSAAAAGVSTSTGKTALENQITQLKTVSACIPCLQAAHSVCCILWLCWHLKAAHYMTACPSCFWEE